MTAPLISADEALERLLAGNRRFVADESVRAGRSGPTELRALAAAQHPFATILGCSDSRIPIAQMFDLGPGDLFVVRVAGNVAGPTEVGSIEYAVEVLGTRLVMVLGHSCCGAVAAALETSGEATHSAALISILDQVREALDPLFAEHPERDPSHLMDASVAANARYVAAQLPERSRPLAERLDDGLRIVPAVIDLATGVVSLLEE